MIAVAETFTLDAECAAAVHLAREAAVEAAAANVGEHLGAQAEGERVVTHGFATTLSGYQGWYWAVTVSRAPGFEPTVAEVSLLPGDTALRPPPWMPWSQRLEPGDLGPGDLLPVAPGDPRLVPAYVLSDDLLERDVALELGLGRERVLSRLGRLEAAERWQAGECGPESPMAKQAPAQCGTCGFFLSLADSLRAAFGVCANEVTESDGRVVSVEYGCGAHSDAVIEIESEWSGEVYEDDAIDVLDPDEYAADPVPDAVEVGSAAAVPDAVEVGSAAPVPEAIEPAADGGEQQTVDVEAFAVHAAGGDDARDARQAQDEPGTP